MIADIYGHHINGNDYSNLTIGYGIEGLMDQMAVFPNVKYCYPLIRDDSNTKSLHTD
jgi:hypothetical protein